MTKSETKIVDRAEAKYKSLMDSRDMDYITEKVRIRDGVYLYFEAYRVSQEEIEENNYSFEPGEAAWIEAWVEKNGEAIDGVGDCYGRGDIEYLVRMYSHSYGTPGRKPKVSFR